MKFSVQEFLIVNGLIVTILVAWIYLGRKSKPGHHFQIGVDPDAMKKSPPNISGLTRSSSSAMQSQKVEVLDPEAAATHSLNIMFNFNGHTWDAYEVLGIPAGSSFERVRLAYEAALDGISSNESREFLNAAYGAIIASYRLRNTHFR